MSKKKHKKRQQEIREDNNFNNNPYDNPNPYNNFDNSPLGQISKMIGNIDMNTLAQLLANFNIQGNEYDQDEIESTGDKKEKIQYKEKQVKDKISGEKINRDYNTVDRTEDRTKEGNENIHNEIIDNIENMDDVKITDIEDYNEYDIDKREKVVRLLICLRNLCDEKIKEEINRLIEIYSSN
ncbi:hypothetical protein [Haloimpatiens lingqiaonensis]|uniref:hypothetical protein n=1 Tax=Haloimpatiens lingqiaonensis TaxID=1380675 RepID=UPI0010FD157F|nr:hypothetical protein [Haloimpatiens lingqiaonensis]